MEDTNLIIKFGVGCCGVVRLDATEYWAGMLLSNDSGCCWVSVEDTNLITEFGVGCCRVLMLDAVESWAGRLLSIGLGRC